MSGWRIVPHPYNDEMVEAAVPAMWTEKPHANGKAGFLQFRAGWNAAIAAAPEPDWEALADAAFDAEAEAFAECVANGTVMQHGQHYARRISILAALKATFGNAP